MGPSDCLPSSCFDDATEEAILRANIVVAAGHANVRASAAMTDNDNDDNANKGDFSDTLAEILDATFMASPVLDLDLAFGAADNDNFGCPVKL